MANTNGEISVVVADASALLPAWLPSERHQVHADRLIELHALGKIQLCGPAILPHEILNSLYIAVRGKGGSPPRLTPEGALERWELFCQLQIEVRNVDHLAERVLALSLAYGRPSSYDMAYVALAEALKAPMVTVDERLLNAVGEQLTWVQALWEFTLR